MGADELTLLDKLLDQSAGIIFGLAMAAVAFVQHRAHRAEMAKLTAEYVGLVGQMRDLLRDRKTDRDNDIELKRDVRTFLSQLLNAQFKCNMQQHREP